jgi:autotransporter-associated beta strand protein
MVRLKGYALAVGVSAMLFCGKVLAQPVIWTGASGANWSIPTNWNSGAGPIPTSSSDVQFNGGATSTVDECFTINSLTFEAGSPISIGGTSPLTVLTAITNDSVNSAGIGTPTTLGPSESDSATVGLSGLLAFSGDVTLASSSTTLQEGAASKIAIGAKFFAASGESDVTFAGGGGSNSPSVTFQGEFDPCGNFSQATVYGSALVFDSDSVNLSSKELYIGSEGNQGYIGYTEATGYSPSTFLSYIDECSVNGVIGFDTHSGSDTVCIGSIDLTQDGGAPFTANTFLGTSTSANLMGCITPVSASVGYKFTGILGGALTVSTNLGDDECPTGVTIGLSAPMEVNSSVSSVTLSGSNSYTGGTLLNSGILYVTNCNSLGGTACDTLTADSQGGGVPTPVLAASGGSVTLPNNIVINFHGLVLNQNNSSPALTLTGTISDYGSFDPLTINGPTDLEGCNTYSGGTTINGTTVTIGTNSGLGTGAVTATSGSILDFTSCSPSVNGLTLTGTTVNFTNESGNPLLTGLKMMGGSTITFAADSSPEIANMYSDSGSGNVISLGSGTDLTFEEGVDPTYSGTITGSGNVSFVGEGGGGEIDLAGANSLFTGNMTVGSGILLVADNNMALGNGGTLTLCPGAIFGVNSGITISNPITVNPGSSLSSLGGFVGGYGTIATSSSITFGAYSGVVGGRGTFANGDTSNPLIGTLTFGTLGTPASLTFSGNSGMAFSIMNSTGTAGTDFSLVNVVGSVTFDSSISPETPFTVEVIGFNGTTTGAALTFDNTSMHSWTLLSATSMSFTGGFSALNFSIDTSNFSNSLGTGGFYVSQSGNNLVLNFTPVPEPSTWVLMAGGLCVLVAAAVRRRRSV